jgi:hypothetical protein
MAMMEAHMNTPNVEELCNLGDQHLADEQWEEADILFQQALSFDAKSRRALLGRAIVKADCMPTGRITRRP